MLPNLWGSVAGDLAHAVAGRRRVVNIGAMHLARIQSIKCVGRSGRRVPMWTMVGEVSVRAAVWLSLPLYLFPSLDPGDAGDFRVDHGGPRDRRARPGRRAAVRHDLDGGLHRRRGRIIADGAAQHPFPAHAVDPVHARRRDLRRTDRRALGLSSAQDQRRCRQPEREREPAASGI